MYFGCNESALFLSHTFCFKIYFDTERETYRANIHWITPSVAPVVGAGPGESRERGSTSRSPTGMGEVQQLEQPSDAG